MCTINQANLEPFEHLFASCRPLDGLYAQRVRRPTDAHPNIIPYCTQSETMRRSRSPLRSEASPCNIEFSTLFLRPWMARLRLADLVTVAAGSACVLALDTNCIHATCEQACPTFPPSQTRSQTHRKLCGFSLIQIARSGKQRQS